MVKRIIVASALALFSIALAGAGGCYAGAFCPRPAANYNAERVHDECVTRFDAQTNGGIP